VLFLVGRGSNVAVPSGAVSTLRAVPVLLDLPGPSRRIRVEPLRLPAPAQAPREREPDPVEPERVEAPEREPVPA
jgi:hypothetical protein